MGTKMAEEKLQFPKFEDIPVSTKTFIVMTNLVVNIGDLYDYLPITPYVIVPKKRGRKKKTKEIDPNKDIPDGSIIALEMGKLWRGVQVKKKKKKNDGKADYFRNSITVVMIMDGKKINFKICKNGKFQMTGCKKDEHAENCVKYIWDYLRRDGKTYKLNGTSFKAMFIPAMRNIDFSLGFTLDREKLDEYINVHTNYYSLLETSIGYTGVNVKIPVTKPITELRLKELTWKDGKWLKEKYVPYQKYLDTMKPKEQQKKLDQERFNTFLVFHSGNVICSSMCEEFSRDVYYEFIDIIQKNHVKFREKLSV